MKRQKIYDLPFADIYPLYRAKIEKKGRQKEELDEVIMWLTGYKLDELQGQIEKNISMETFFFEAPKMNPNCDKITGLICGIRVEEVEDPLMKKIRMLDKLVDELAKGKAMEKIFRK